MTNMTMDLKAIANLEAAGDVERLAWALNKGIRTHTEGGRIQGDQARAIMENMGFDIIAGAKVNITNMNQIRIVDDSAHVRAEAARALGRLNRPQGNSALIEALNDGTPLVRLAAVEALCQVGGKEMQSALSGFEEKSGMRRFAAIEKAAGLLKG